MERVTFAETYDASQDGITYLQSIEVRYDAYCVDLNAYFARDGEPDSTFQEFLSSFKFKPEGGHMKVAGIVPGPGQEWRIGFGGGS
jgi:hypothetical protein